MNLHQNSLECKTNIQNNPLILWISEANIFCSEVEKPFSNFYKLKVKTIFFDSIGRRVKTPIFDYNLVITINYYSSIKIERSKSNNFLFFVTDNNSLHFFLNKLLAVLRNINVRFRRYLQNLNIFGGFNYF
jgi:hypothetical protein